MFTAAWKAVRPTVLWVFDPDSAVGRALKLLLRFLQVDHQRATKVRRF